MSEWDLASGMDNDRISLRSGRHLLLAESHCNSMAPLSSLRRPATTIEPSGPSTLQVDSNLTPGSMPALVRQVVMS